MLRLTQSLRFQFIGNIPTMVTLPLDTHFHSVKQPIFSIRPILSNIAFGTFKRRWGSIFFQSLNDIVSDLCKNIHIKVSPADQKAAYAVQWQRRLSVRQ